MHDLINGRQGTVGPARLRLCFCMNTSGGVESIHCCCSFGEPGLPQVVTERKVERKDLNKSQCLNPASAGPPIAGPRQQ